MLVFSKILQKIDKKDIGYSLKQPRDSLSEQGCALACCSLSGKIPDEKDSLMI